MFAGGDGVEQELAERTVIFQAGEDHSIRALSEDLILRLSA